MQDIEKTLGRDRTPGERWAPRTIDIDILLDGDRIIDEPGLTIPHPRMHERRFVLEPLCEIAPHVMHPRLRRDVRAMLVDLDRTARRRTKVLPAAMLAILLILGCSTTPCRAQTPDDPTPDAQPALDPDEVFRRITSAYRAAPIADRITLSAVSTYRQRTKTATVRADAATGSVMLTLGPIRALVREGELHVIHKKRGDRYARFVGGNRSVVDLITDSLPPILFPQLSLVFDDPGAPIHLTPFSDAITWSAAIESSEESQLILLGRAGDAIVTYVVDTDTWRLKAGVITVPESELRIEMKIEPIEPGDPADWLLDTRGMIPVSTLAQLQPGGVDIHPGAPVPPMAFFTISSEPWRLEINHEGPIALVLFREISPRVLSARDALRESIDSHESPIDIQPVLVSERLIGIDLFERIGQTVHAWGGPVLWSVSPGVTIDRFTTGPACVALIDADHTVRAVVHLGQGDSSEDESRRIDEAIAAFTSAE